MILVEGALCSRHFGPTNKLAAELGKHFRVYHYDRRARGDFSPSADYSIERELEDLSALIAEAGHVVLPGQTHEVKAEAIAPELVRSFSGAAARIAA